MDSAGMSPSTTTILASQVTALLSGYSFLNTVSRVEVDSALGHYDLRESDLGLPEWRQLASRLNADLLLSIIVKGVPRTAGRAVEVDLMDVRRAGRKPLLRSSLEELIATSLVGSLHLEAADVEGMRYWPYERPPRWLNEEEVSAWLKWLRSPQLAEAAVGGTVELLVLVDSETGRALRAELAASSGHDMLDALALLIADRMRFEPAPDRGDQITLWVRERIVFPVLRTD